MGEKKIPSLKTFQIIIISRLDFDKSKEEPPANVEQVIESFNYLHNYYLTRTTYYLTVVGRLNFKKKSTFFYKICI